MSEAQKRFNEATNQVDRAYWQGAIIDCGIDGHFDDELCICFKCYEDEVAKAERERIIALLETRLDDCHEKNDRGGWSFMPELFIALIKGEN